MAPDRAVGGGSFDVGMISKGAPHPAHAGFAEAVGATRIELSPRGPAGSVLEEVVSSLQVARADDHEVYLAEDGVGLYAAPLIRSNDSKLVFLAAMHRLTPEAYDLQPFTVVKQAVRWADRRFDIAALQRLLRRYVDGVVAVSELTAATVRQIDPDVPVRVAHPYVQPDRYETLQAVEPGLDENTVVFVGTNREHKGVDLLVEAWPRVREQIPDASLELVGQGHPGRHGSVPGVSCRGYVAHIQDAFESSSLYVQPSRYEPFGIAPVEAMLAGVPAAVSSRTGVSPYVSAVDKHLVFRPEPRKIADAVVWYLRQSGEVKREYSKQARERARAFDERTRTKTFAREFRSVLNEIT